MTADKLLDIIGNAKDKYIAEASPYEKRKSIDMKKVIILAACLILVTITALAAGRMLAVPGRAPKDSVVRVFMIDNSAYYIRADGQLYLLGANEDTYIHAFPKHTVCYSDELGGFVYLNKGVIRVFDPQTKAETLKLDLKMGKKNAGARYVIAASDGYIYFTWDKTDYRVNTESGEISKVSEPIRRTVFKNAEYAVMHEKYGEAVYVTELETGITRSYNCETDYGRVVSATVTDNTLYYVTSEGRLRFIDLSKAENTDSDAIGLPYKVLAVEAASGKLLCVVTETLNGMQLTGVAAVDTDGSYSMLLPTGGPYYRGALGSCIMDANGHGFIYTVTGSKTVRRGSFDTAE